VDRGGNVFVELKTYLSILWRRWYIVVLVPLIVLVGVVYQSRNSKLTYSAQARVSVVRSSEEPQQTQYFQYDGYYQYLASEYALDDLVQVVQGNVFASDVARDQEGHRDERFDRRSSGS